MSPIKSTPFSFLTAKEFDALEGFMWLLIHGRNSLIEQAFISGMIFKILSPFTFGIGPETMEKEIRAERERRTYPNGKPPLLTE